MSQPLRSLQQTTNLKKIHIYHKKHLHFRIIQTTVQQLCHDGALKATSYILAELTHFDHAHSF